MKKVHLLLVTVLCLSSSAFAKKVDLETAKKVGVNFFYERLSQHQQVNYHQLSVKNVFSENVDGKDVYYAMNFPEGGFVIVASDDAVTPILAYSYEGAYSAENHPPQFNSWMENYTKQINYCIKDNLAADLQMMTGHV